MPNFHLNRFQRIEKSRQYIESMRKWRQLGKYNEELRSKISTIGIKRRKFELCRQKLENFRELKVD